MKTCAECSTQFARGNAGTFLCSKRCTDAWHNRRKRSGIPIVFELTCFGCGVVFEAPNVQSAAKCPACSKHKTRAATAAVLRRLGWDIVDYEAALACQQGCCAICGRESDSRRLCADHDHTSGKPRGLLCAQCNAALGVVEANTGWLDSARAYLERWSEV